MATLFAVLLCQVSLEDKLRDVPRLREEGNTLYRAGRAREAATVYARALSYLDRIKGEPSLLASPEYVRPFFDSGQRFLRRLCVA